MNLAQITLIIIVIVGVIAITDYMIRIFKYIRKRLSLDNKDRRKE